MDTSTLEQMMLPVEDRVYSGGDYIDCVEPALVLRTRYRCAEALLTAINSGKITAEQAVAIYEEACKRTLESEMAKPNTGESVVRARLLEIMPRQQQTAWSWEDVIQRSALPRNIPGVAIDILGQYVLQVGDQAVEFDEEEDSFRILDADGKVRTVGYEKLKTFRPSAVSGEKGIRIWERGFKRRRESDVEAEGIMRH